MTFWEWLGFENPRDSPQPETPPPKEGLPQVTDNVRDSGQTFVFGRSNAGEQVDEKAAMQIPTVYACAAGHLCHDQSRAGLEHRLCSTDAGCLPPFCTHQILHKLVLHDFVYQKTIMSRSS